MRNLLELPGKPGDELVALRDGEKTNLEKEPYKKGDKFIFDYFCGRTPTLVGLQDQFGWYKSEDFGLAKQGKIIGYKAPMDLFNGNVPKDTVYRVCDADYIAVPLDNSKGDLSYSLPIEIVDKWEGEYEKEEETFTPGDIVYVVEEYPRQMGKTGDLKNKLVKFLRINVDDSWDREYKYVVENYDRDRLEDAVVEVRKATSTEIETYKEENKIYVAGHEAQFIGNRVQFGCQSFTKEEIQFISNLVNKGGARYSLHVEGNEVPKKVIKRVLIELNKS